MTPKVGDTVKRRIEYGMNGGTLLPPETGTVVYVHPEGRFYRVEFSFPSRWGVRRFCESYITERTGVNTTPFTRGPLIRPYMPEGFDD